jgi:N-glycosylase/DNA lyase
VTPKPSSDQTELGPSVFTLDRTACFDLELCVTSGQLFRWKEVADATRLGVDGDNWYRASLGPETILIDSNAGPEEFQSLFRLDWNAPQVEEDILKNAPELEPYMVGLRGLRVTRHSDPVETFFSFLCTPNNNIKRITQMVRKLAARGQVLAEIQGVKLHRFPEPEVIAEIPEDDLRAEAFGYRAKTIPHLAGQLIERGGRTYLEELTRARYKEAHKELASMKGIGPKLADCICLFGLHHDEAVPVDTHIWQAMCRLYFPEWQGKPLTGARYYHAADFFRDRLGSLAGWAHQYLFYDNVLNWRSRP